MIEIIAGLAVVLFLVLSVRVVPETERLGVIRLGCYIGTRGPGIVFLIPLAEKAFKVDLQRDIPGWRSMPAEALEREVERFITRYTVK